MLKTEEWQNNYNINSNSNAAGQSASILHSIKENC